MGLGRWGLAAVVGAAALGPGARAVAQSRPAFFKDSRGDLATARARGDTAVTLVLAARPGQSAALARAVARLGGTVERRVASVDYVRVRVPTAQAEAVAALPAVVAAAVSTRVTGRTSRAYQAAPGAARGIARSTEARGDSTPTVVWPPPPSRYPLEHPYSPLADLGAAEWPAAHPAWDGRGVTIADLEWMPDVFAPELQTGRTLAGTSVPKFVDIRNSVAPTTIDDSSGVVWLRMRTTVVAQAGRFRDGSRSYIAPRPGRFRFDVLNERRFGFLQRLKGDLNFDGNPPGADSLFAVLWDAAHDTVWVDSDQDGDFTDEPPLMDFAVRGDLGRLGRDDPATPRREMIAFAVQIDTRARVVALNLGLGSHATAVQGAAAGLRGATGHYDGVAPGARLASISYGAGSAATLTEAMIQAFTDPRIDIVVLEQQTSVMDHVYGVHDGRSVPSVICNRLVSRFRKPFLVPGGNAPGLAAVGEHAAAAGALGIGAYEGAESYRINHGVVPAFADNLHVVGAGGPAGNGALKPDLLAPSNVLSSDVAFEPGGRVEGLYELPPGYAIAGGTSTATPVAAGAVALLISAAKQTGTPYDAARLRRALLTTARPLAHIAPFDQGNGLLQVAAAWEALRRLAHEPATAAPVAIAVQAPVRTALSDWLVPAHTGPGLYELGGWRVGERDERTLTLTRTTGPAGTQAFAVRWRGADGTFKSAERVVLPLNAPVRFPITITPATTGAHSAILELFEPATGRPVQRISCVIVVPQVFGAPAYTLTVHDSVPRPGRYNLFLTVPPGTGALAVDFRDVSGDVMVSVARPDARLAAFWRVDCTGGLRYLPQPAPGVWQLSMIGDVRTLHRFQQPGTPLTPALFTLQASLVSVSVDVDLDNAAAGGWTVTARNQMAEVAAAISTAPLASGAPARGWLRPGTQRVYPVDVPAGTTLLLAEVTPPGVPPGAADLDLYLFDCTHGPCEPAASSADSGGAARLAYPRPAAGRWKLVVDAARVRGDSVPYEYLDLVLNPLYGTVAVADPMTKRAAGAAWRAPVQVWQAQPVATPRRPYAVFLAEDGRLALADTKMVPLEVRLPVAWTAVPLAP